MPNLIVIIGAPASGKSAIGSRVAESLGYRFFHNHLTADPAAALFGWLTPEFSEAVDELRELLFERAANAQEIPGIVFTFVWTFNEDEDKQTIQHFASKFLRTGGKVVFIKLLASLETRISREDTPLRKIRKPNHGSVEEAVVRQREFDKQYTMNSGGTLPLPYPHLVVDTELFSEAESANKIVGFLKENECT